MEEKTFAGLSDQLLKEKVNQTRIILKNEVKRNKTGFLSSLFSTIAILIVGIALFAIDFPVAYDGDGNPTATFHQFAIYPFYVLAFLAGAGLVLTFVFLNFWRDYKKKLAEFSANFPEN